MLADSRALSATVRFAVGEPQRGRHRRLPEQLGFSYFILTARHLHINQRRLY